VPPDQLESIFESFSQVQRPEGPLGGSGLGLTISREFARLLGGDITVTSEVGRGSTFVLTLLISGAE
jgi:signal transduction histidine kinase